MQSDSEKNTKPPALRLMAAGELILAAAIVFAANIFGIVPISETPWLIAIGWISLRLRSLGWRSIGLFRPKSWPKTIALGILSGIGLQIVSEYVIEPLILNFTGQKADLSDFASLEGNLPGSLVLVVLAWTLGAFGEELAYRGYIVDRAAALGKYSTAAYIAAVVLVSVFFGIGHYYQGPAGVLGSIFSGLLFGTLYLVSGRNLWLPIFAHGFSNTLGVILIYSGLVHKL